MTPDEWLTNLEARHLANLTRPELTRAVRALSARYVEKRAALPGRSPLDSAGKRAAFALFYSPLHFLTVSAVVEALGAAARPLTRIVDLGCGTGVAGAAWSVAFAEQARPTIEGVDKNAWALDEARWNWRTLGLHGQARRGDLIEAARAVAGDRRSDRLSSTGVVAGWAINELTRDDRAALLTALLDVAARGPTLLIIEPLARAAAPWWEDWAAPIERAGGRADEWKFDIALPLVIKPIDDAAGFRREQLGARSLFVQAGVVEA